MATATLPSLVEEFAGFLSRGPTPEEILRYRPPAHLVARNRELVSRLKEGGISAEERRELDHFVFMELVMQMTWAMIRASREKQP